MPTITTGPSKVFSPSGITVPYFHNCNRSCLTSEITDPQKASPCLVILILSYPIIILSLFCPTFNQVNPLMKDYHIKASLIFFMKWPYIGLRTRQPNGTLQEFSAINRLIINHLTSDSKKTVTIGSSNTLTTADCHCFFFESDVITG